MSTQAEAARSIFRVLEARNRRRVALGMGKKEPSVKEQLALVRDTRLNAIDWSHNSFGALDAESRIATIAMLARLGNSLTHVRLHGIGLSDTCAKSLGEKRYGSGQYQSVDEPTEARRERAATTARAFEPA